LKHLKPFFGAKWLKVGTACPSTGTLIRYVLIDSCSRGKSDLLTGQGCDSCPELEVALKAKNDRNFTRAELEGFAVESLREGSYIKVGSEYYVAATGKGWDHNPWSVKRLRWAVSLGEMRRLFLLKHQ